MNRKAEGYTVRKREQVELGRMRLARRRLPLVPVLHWLGRGAGVASRDGGTAVMRFQGLPAPPGAEEGGAGCLHPHWVPTLLLRNPNMLRSQLRLWRRKCKGVGMIWVAFARLMLSCEVRAGRAE